MNFYESLEKELQLDKQRDKTQFDRFIKKDDKEQSSTINITTIKNITSSVDATMERMSQASARYSQNSMMPKMSSDAASGLDVSEKPIEMTKVDH